VRLELNLAEKGFQKIPKFEKSLDYASAGIFNKIVQKYGKSKGYRSF